jgi:hypothetical protein
MLRGSAWVVVFAVATTGCMLDRRREERPARIRFGVTTHRLSSELGESLVAERGNEPMPTSTKSAPSTAITGSAQFTMAWRGPMYLGIEAEGGAMARSGSNYAGGYGVIGAESESGIGSLAVEVVAGRRWLRQDANSVDVASFAVEPRLRAQFWMTDQLTFGAAIGGTPQDRSFMAGVFVGVHSSVFNSWKH